MDKNKKKKLFNIIMVAAICVIAAACVLVIGGIKGGWFDQKETETQIVEADNGETQVVEVEVESPKLEDKTGVVYVERSGVSFEVKAGEELKEGDLILTDKNGSAEIDYKDNVFYLSEKTEVTLTSLENEKMSLELSKGEIFCNVNNEDAFSRLLAQDNEVTDDGSVFSANVQKGSMSVYVFDEGINCLCNEKTETAEEKQELDIVDKEMSVRTLKASSLNDFNLDSIKKVNETRKLCFTDKQVDKVIKDREEVIKVAAKTDESSDKKDSKETSKNQDSETLETEVDNQATQVNEEQINANNEAETVTQSENVTAAKGESKTKADSEAGTKSEKETTTQKNESTTTEEQQETTDDSNYNSKCTLVIDCSTILSNKDKLKSGKEAYVGNGKILNVGVPFNEGETVLDVLKRACDAKKIQLEYTADGYVEGINNLYEFDCGTESGWMFRVNGWYPNYGASSYELKDGDTVEWLYTCDLGYDIGGGY